MKEAHQVTRVDTHRVQVMDDCAEEGGGWTPSAQPIKSVEDEFPWLWALYGIAILATVAACSLIAGAA